MIPVNVYTAMAEHNCLTNHFIQEHGCCKHETCPGDMMTHSFLSFEGDNASESAGGADILKDALTM